MKAVYVLLIASCAFALVIMATSGGTAVAGPVVTSSHDPGDTGGDPRYTGECAPARPGTHNGGLTNYFSDPTPSDGWQRWEVYTRTCSGLTGYFYWRNVFGDTLYVTD